MSPMISMVITGIGLMALVSIAFGSVERLRTPRPVRCLLHGLIFGAAGVAAMATPIELVPGVLVDMRATLIGFAAAFVGLPAALVAAAMSGAYRLWLGGAGAPYGVVAIALSVVGGTIWRQFFYRRDRVDAAALIMLAVALMSPVLALLIMPAPLRDPVWQLFLVSSAVTAIVSAPLMGVMMLREIRLIRRERRLANDAFSDPLTGLANRRALEDQGARLVDTGPSAFAVIMLDIDRFKAINDRYGHVCGDAALCALAELLRRNTRLGDIKARLGGEEFVVVLPDTGRQRALVVAEGLRQAIAREIVRSEGETFGFTASLGVAQGHGPDELFAALARADQALYAAKRGGRNRVEEAVATADGTPEPLGGELVPLPRRARGA